MALVAGRTPWLFGLLLWACTRGLRRAEAGLLLVSVPMLIQWGGVFVFSIAGEYRYLLPFLRSLWCFCPRLSNKQARRFVNPATDPCGVKGLALQHPLRIH